MSRACSPCRRATTRFHAELKRPYKDPVEDEPLRFEVVLTRRLYRMYIAKHHDLRAKRPTACGAPAWLGAPPPHDHNYTCSVLSMSHDFQVSEI